VSIVEQTLEEWRAEVRERLGDPPDPARLAFACPRCGNVATAEQFRTLGEHADRAATNCIGRFLTATDDPGCDWAAYGLLGVLDKGRLLARPDGNTIQVFEFAEVPDD
jgi:hypothetical protein